MTFEALETSQESGSRIELYSLAIGNTVYRMHDDSVGVIAYAGNDYLKVSISRGHIATGQEHLTVHIPSDHEFPLKFTTIAPGQIGTLTIFSYHRENDTDVRVIHKGVVQSVAFTKDMSKSMLAIVPISEAFDKEIPERTYQAPCNNVLFDANCKVSAGLYTYNGLITAVSGNVITASGLLAAKGDDWSTAGFVANGALDYRLILTQSDNDCTLSLPFHADVLGLNLDIYAGCRHTIGVCDSKFSNRINYGGCPYVPTSNIFVTGV